VQIHEFLNLAQVIFSPIFRTDKMYVERQYANINTTSESCFKALIVTVNLLSSAKIRPPCVGERQVCRPNSAQLSCKSFVIIRFSSLVDSNNNRQVSIQFGFIQNAIHQVSSLVAEMFRAHVQHRRAVGQKSTHELLQLVEAKS
jgi:hypothetical protein